MTTVNDLLLHLWQLKPTTDNITKFYKSLKLYLCILQDRGTRGPLKQNDVTLMNISSNSWAKRGIRVFDHPNQNIWQQHCSVFPQKHIWNRYHRQPSLAQAIVSMKKRAIYNYLHQLIQMFVTNIANSSVYHTSFLVPSGRRSYQ